MGRIAYLSKRGNMWWFRRRFAVIFIKSLQSNQVSGVCLDTGTKAQAMGHLATILQTSSARQARLIGAQVSADFERAWSMIEAHMSDTDAEDAIAMAMTNGFRSYIGAPRTGIAANQDLRLKERAYRIVEADIRNALGIEADQRKHITATSTAQEPSTETSKPEVSWPETEDISEDDLIVIEAEMEEHEGYTLLSHLGPSVRTESDYYAEHIVNELCGHTGTFRATISEYLYACERLGLDPRKAKPDLEGSQRIGAGARGRNRLSAQCGRKGNGLRSGQADVFLPRREISAPALPRIRVQTRRRKGKCQCRAAIRKELPAKLAIARACAH